MALKKLLSVTRHFDDYYEDQHDFHYWCLRKMTLQTYVPMLRVWEAIRRHRAFQRASRALARVYLALHAVPMKERMGDDGMLSAEDLANMTSAERKRAKNEARKVKQRREKLLQRRLARAKALMMGAGASGTGKGGGEVPDLPSWRGTAEYYGEGDEGPRKKKERNPTPAKPDADPLGLELVKEENPVKKAWEVIATALKYRGENGTGGTGDMETDEGRFMTHCVAADVAMELGKYLLAIREVMRAKELFWSHPQVFIRVVRLCLAFQRDANKPKKEEEEREQEQMPATVRDLVKKSLPDLLGTDEPNLSVALRTYVEKYVKENATRSPLHCHLCAEGRVILALDDAGVDSRRQGLAAALKANKGVLAEAFATAQLSADDVRCHMVPDPKGRRVADSKCFLGWLGRGGAPPLAKMNLFGSEDGSTVDSLQAEVKGGGGGEGAAWGENKTAQEMKEALEMEFVKAFPGVPFS